METVDYIELLNGSADRCGLDRSDLGEVEFGNLRDKHSDALRSAWEFQYWSDLIVTEKRTYRPEWDQNATYAAGVEVYYPPTQKYYVATDSSTGQTPDSLVSWSECGAEFVRNVSLDQAGQTPIGIILAVLDANPDLVRNARSVSWSKTAMGIVVLRDLPFVYVTFKQRCPVLKGEPFDATLAYPPGQQFYYSSPTCRGNFYDVLALTSPGDTPESVPGSFQLVPIPRIFGRYLKAQAAGEWLSENQNDNAEDQFTLAAAALVNLGAVLTGQEGQTQATEVLTR